MITLNAPVAAPSTSVHAPAADSAPIGAPVTVGGRPLLGPGGAPAAAERHHAGSRWIGIDHVDAMAPFLTTAVGDNDCWLFAGSNGVLCAGRRDPDHALFPYLNADRLLEHPGSAGMMTAVLIEDHDGTRLWEPWSPGSSVHPRRRALFRHEDGAGLLFEEVDLDSGLTLLAELATCARFGLVRRVRLINRGSRPRRVRVLDGWHHLLPPGIGMEGWRDLSYLAQAYMRHELAPAAPGAFYTLNAAISDRAEPREMLRCACAWVLGPTRPALLSLRQIDSFRQGGAIAQEHEVRGAAGALLAQLHAALAPGQALDWTMGADTGLDQAAAIALCNAIAARDAAATVDAALAADRAGLRRRLAAADGLSATGAAAADDHHRANVLFNLMRGGVLAADAGVARDDFLAWLGNRDRAAGERHRARIAEWPERIALADLPRLAALAGDAQLSRLAGSYLPLSFSRRHGDPSRPWNRFSIRLHDDHGRAVSAWQGNWRDIFQNWEALALSFPTALPAMIATYLDATTADGYNPYRISSEGIDWEVPEPGPWSHFGYWGDHQIVYLTRLLDLADRHFPGWIGSRLDRRAHACADVPYRIAGYDDLVRDPHHGVAFDHGAHAAALARVAANGADGRLLPGPDGAPLLLSLAEKLLIPVLAKLSNLVPGGGIWLNTQRPEWNDANNALVGWGLSVVTVCQLRAHLVLLGRLFNGAGPWPCSAATASFLVDITAALADAGAAACGDDALRLAAMERLGRAGERHRAAVYRRDLGDVTIQDRATPGHLIAAALTVVDATIAANQRADGTWHSYNILEITGSDAVIHHLDLMLEGQVAVLSCGALDEARALGLLAALRAGPLWDEARGTYLLYPDRAQTPFLERNRIAASAAGAGALIPALLARGDRRVIVRDPDGDLRFAADLGNARDLARRLDAVAGDAELSGAVANDRAMILGLWEATFRHRGYLGRSGTMFAFEGLGSVYWHMVSKLLLAVLERHRDSAQGGARTAAAAGLEQAWAEIRSGLGPARTPAEFGAFPSDPYSHTPAHAGAQQPGMTGQVKEGILIRRGELGVEVEQGCLRFAPRLLRPGDLRATAGMVTWCDRGGRLVSMATPADSLAFTVCQVPVVYHAARAHGIVVTTSAGRELALPGQELPRELSQSVFTLDGTIARIDFGIRDLLG